MILNELFENNKDLISRSALSEEVKNNDFNWLKNKLQCLHLIARQPPIDIDQIKNQAIDEFSKALIDKLEDYKTKAYVTGITDNPYEFGACSGMNSAMKIVNEMTEEYKHTGLERENENMSMTENEAIERLQTLNIILTDKAGHKEDGIDKIFTFSDITAICKAIQALEEIQQYKEIGTVQGYERAIQVSLENYNLYKEYKAKVQEFEAIGTIDDYWKLNEMCKEYSAIGTVEELKALRSDNFTEDLLNVGFTKGYNKAIDEFTERLKEKLQAMSDEPAYYHENEDYFVGICSAENVVDDIAEQLKNGTDINREDIDLDR